MKQPLPRHWHCWAGGGLNARGSAKAWRPDMDLTSCLLLSKQEEKQDGSGIVSRNTNLVFQDNSGPARPQVQITFVREVPWQCHAYGVVTVVSRVVRQSRMEQSRRE